MSDPVAADQPFLELRGVSKVYGMGDATVHALRSVNLCIQRGDFMALMGPSGSGKSTCLNILGCLDTPTVGEFYFRGVPTSRLDRDRRALLRRSYLGFVFQGFNLMPRTSAIENVELPLIYRGISRRLRRRMAMKALHDVGLEGRERHKPNELSGGQQQRVAIARALVTDPNVLLADEPTGNLDSVRGLEVMRLLAVLNQERGLTIAMVTHEADMAAFANRVVRFLDGSTSEDRALEVVS